MASLFRRDKAPKVPHQPSGAWYSDPYGAAARRWYDDTEGWSPDRIEGEGEEPDRTGVVRLDESARDTFVGDSAQTTGPDTVAASSRGKYPDRMSHAGG